MDNNIMMPSSELIHDYMIAEKIKLLEDIKKQMLNLFPAAPISFGIDIVNKELSKLEEKRNG